MPGKSKSAVASANFSLVCAGILADCEKSLWQGQGRARLGQQGRGCYGAAPPLTTAGAAAAGPGQQGTTSPPRHPTALPWLEGKHRWGGALAVSSAPSSARHPHLDTQQLCHGFGLTPEKKASNNSAPIGLRLFRKQQTHALLSRSKAQANDAADKLFCHCHIPASPLLAENFSKKNFLCHDPFRGSKWRRRSRPRVR